MYKQSFPRLILITSSLLVLPPVPAFSQTRAAAAAPSSHNTASGTLTITITVVPSVTVTDDRQLGAQLVAVKTPAASLGVDKVMPDGAAIEAAGSGAAITYVIPSATAIADTVEVVQPYWVRTGPRRIKIGVLRTLTVVMK